MPNYSDETIADALDGIQRRRYVLPAIQREFVWGTDRICALFDSLMRDYPINSLLYWSVGRENADEYRWYDFVLNYHELENPAPLTRTCRLRIASLSSTGSSDSPR